MDTVIEAANGYIGGFLHEKKTLFSQHIPFASISQKDAETIREDIVSAARQDEDRSERKVPFLERR